MRISDWSSDVCSSDLFRHPETVNEIDRLLLRLHENPERCVLVGAYALGKAQRVIMELRCRGHEDPIYIHGALQRLCDLYAEQGIALGDLRPATGAAKEELKGRIILCPPGALNDRWSRRLPDPTTAMASGWMRIRQRARQRNVELPLIISDQAVDRKSTRLNSRQGCASRMPPLAGKTKK